MSKLINDARLNWAFNWNSRAISGNITDNIYDISKNKNNNTCVSKS